MNFPLDFTFKFVALAPQFSVHDATGVQLCYVRQKLFKFKESISVFKDETKSELLSEIKADQIIDFSASYSFIDRAGLAYGSVKRKGLRSIWRAHYEIFEGDLHTYTIQEGNPWVKMLDSIFDDIPILGMLSGYVLNPRYDVVDQQGETCYTLYKKPSLIGRRFELAKKVDSDDDDILVMMSLIMMTFLERRRG